MFMGLLRPNQVFGIYFTPPATPHHGGARH
jgi:hypothetical protein